MNTATWGKVVFGVWMKPVRAMEMESTSTVFCVNRWPMTRDKYEYLGVIIPVWIFDLEKRFTTPAPYAELMTNVYTPRTKAKRNDWLQMKTLFPLGQQNED